MLKIEKKFDDWELSAFLSFLGYSRKAFQSRTPFFLSECKAIDSFSIEEPSSPWRNKEEAEEKPRLLS